MKINILPKLKELLLTLKSKLKIILVVFSVFLAIFTAFTIFANVYSYFDPFNFCYIGINNNSLRGNQKTIKKAIYQIKSEDQQSYKTLCNNVDTIVEDYCQASDVRGTGGIGQDIGLYEPGCYIRGSKIIYLIPNQIESNNVIRLRSQIIKKYAYFSKNFWESEIK